MPLHVTDNQLVAETATIPSAVFPNLVERHLRSYTETRRLEQEATALKSADFTEQELKEFIRHVCTWGGYAGIASRVINQNSIVTVREYFRRAISRLALSSHDVQEALQEINRIRGLGRPSFASKHLRFLQPAICPILDSIVSRRLRYRFNPQGYRSLSEDCLRIAEALQSNQITNPMNRENGRWFAADVEMALFAYLNNL